MLTTTTTSAVVTAADANIHSKIELSPSLMLMLIVTPIAVTVDENKYRELLNDLYPPKLSNAAKILAGAITFFLILLTVATALIATIPGRPEPKLTAISALNPDAVALFNIITSDEFHEFQRSYNEQFLADNVAATTREREAARKELEAAKKKADGIEDGAAYAFAPFILPRPPGTQLTVNYAAEVETTNRQGGCDIVVKMRKETVYYANLAPSSCIETGKVLAGTVIGKWGDKAVGKRVIYNR